jgi:AP2-like factor (ANT lineage)
VTNFDISKYDVKRICASTHLIGGGDACKHSPTRPPDALPALATDAAGADRSSDAPGGGGDQAASDNSDTSDGHRGAHLLHGLQYGHPMKLEAGEGSSWMAAAAASRPVPGVHQLPVFALWNDC